VIYGLGAAVVWGMADLTAAVTGRRIGVLSLAAISQLGGLVTVVVLVAAVRPELPVDPILLVPVASGVIAAGAFLFLYEGLTRGPIALVSPIAAGFAVVTILLSVVFLHESLTGLVLVGVATTIAGVLLASTDLRDVRTRGKTLQGGVPFAIGALVCFGFVTFLIGFAAREAGWLVTVFISRAVGTVVLVTVALVQGAPIRSVRQLTLIPAALVGVADSLGIASYSYGSSVGAVSVVVAVASTFSLIPVMGGVVLFHERPAPNQWLGVGMVMAGLVLLGIAS